MNEETKKLYNEVIRHRTSIIQDFYKAYLAENIKSVPKIKDLELVEEIKDGSFTWYFRPKTKEASKLLQKATLVYGAPKNE